MLSGDETGVQGGDLDESRVSGWKVGECGEVETGGDGSKQEIGKDDDDDED